jgi:hypothetical protein
MFNTRSRAQYLYCTYSVGRELFMRAAMKAGEDLHYASCTGPYSQFFVTVLWRVTRFQSRDCSQIVIPFFFVLSVSISRDRALK